MSLTSRIVSRFLGARGAPYAAVFLNRPSQRRLLAWWEHTVGVPLLGDIKADHMTIRFKPSEAEIKKIPVGTGATIRVVGYAADEKGQAVLVSSSTPSWNKHPHVTVAVAPGVGAVYSNELLARGYTKLAGPYLTGIIDIRGD